MADISPNFAIRQFMPAPLVVVTGGKATPASGVAIVAPIGCAQVVIENTDTGNAIQVWTDPAAPMATQKNIPAGLELTLRASALAWGAGATVCYVSAANPQGVVTCTFLR